MQLFTKNNNQWRAKPITDAEVERFASALATTGVHHPIAHNSYLINLASFDDVLWNKSIDSMVEELERASRLGIPYVVAHPGAHVGAGEDAGLKRIAAALDLVFERASEASAKIALETTAGQGSCLGHRFEHLGEIIERCGAPERLAVCVDTCHVFAAGYPLAPRRAYNHTMRELDRRVGMERVVAFHVNDSKSAFGSRVDRHEHIGKGQLGLEPFESLVNDRRFRETPMYLETPKTTDSETGREWDAINLETLRGLLRPARSRTSRNKQ